MVGHPDIGMSAVVARDRPCGPQLQQQIAETVGTLQTAGIAETVNAPLRQPSHQEAANAGDS